MHETSHGFLTATVTGGRNDVLNSFFKKIIERLLDCHFFRFRKKNKIK